MYIEKYNRAIRSPNTSFVCLVELVDMYETQATTIMFDVLDSSGSIKVSFQNGIRRSVKITLDNSNNQYNIDINKIWIYQKFRVKTGIKFINEHNETEEMLFPQGVYYISNPESVYNPELRTITLEGVDKWARLDGSLGGTLEATYAFPKNYTDKDGVKHTQEYNMFDVIRNLLRTPIKNDVRNIAFIPKLEYDRKIYWKEIDHDPNYLGTFTSLPPIGDYNVGDVIRLEIDNSNYYWEKSSQHFCAIVGSRRDEYPCTPSNVGEIVSFVGEDGCYECKVDYDYIFKYYEAAYTSDINGQINKFLEDNGFDIFLIKNKEAITDSSTGYIFYCDNFPRKNPNIAPTWTRYYFNENMVIDNIEPLLNNWFLTEDKLGIARVMMPYSITKKMGSSLADILLEINTILGGSIYYDRTGRLVLEPTQNQIDDSDKEIVWSFVEGDGIFAGMQASYDFEGVYNQVVVQGTIVDSGVYTVWVQNDDAVSPVSVDRIGTKTVVYDNVGTYDYRRFMELLNVDEETAISYVKDNLRDYANWLLKRHTTLSHTATIRCLPLHHLDVNQVVRVTLKDGTTNKYLINSIDIPLDPTDEMTISVVSVFE